MTKSIRTREVGCCGSTSEGGCCCDRRDVSCRVPKVSSGRRIIVGALVLVDSVCRGVVVVVLFDLCCVCWRQRRPSLGALRSRGGGGGWCSGSCRERDLLVQSCLCALCEVG